VLAKTNRLRSGKDFARTTKTGLRASAPSLVLYLLVKPDCSAGPKVGLIVNSSIGGSVTRHRISRQLRHFIKPLLPQLPEHSYLVIRVLRQSDQYQKDLETALKLLTEQVSVRR
jgi:ribonuclease P protein component